MFSVPKHQETPAMTKVARRLMYRLMASTGRGANQVSHQTGCRPLPPNKRAEAVTTAAAHNRADGALDALTAVWVDATEVTSCQVKMRPAFWSRRSICSATRVQKARGVAFNAKISMAGAGYELTPPDPRGRIIPF